MNHWVFAIRNCSSHRLNGLWPRAEQMGPSASTGNTWESAKLNECVKLDPHTVSPWGCQPNYSGLCKWVVLSFWSRALFLKIKQIYRHGGQMLASDRKRKGLPLFHSPGQYQLSNVSAFYVNRSLGKEQLRYKVYHGCLVATLFPPPIRTTKFRIGKMVRLLKIPNILQTVYLHTCWENWNYHAMSPSSYFYSTMTLRFQQDLMRFLLDI